MAEDLQRLIEAMTTMPAGLRPGFVYILKHMTNKEQPYTDLTEAQARQIAAENPETAPFIDTVLNNLALSVVLFRGEE